MATSVVPDSVRDLVERFDRNRAGYDPVFDALGWDVENRKGSSRPSREVIFEPALKVGDDNRMRAHHFPTGEMHRHSAGMTGHARSPRL